MHIKQIGLLSFFIYQFKCNIKLSYITILIKYKNYIFIYLYIFGYYIYIYPLLIQNYLIILIFLKSIIFRNKLKYKHILK